MKKLRKKIVLGVFLSATVVFALTVLLVGISLNIHVTRRADSLTELIMRYDGNTPPVMDMELRGEGVKLPLDNNFFGEETFYRLRFFTVSYQDDSVECDLGRIASVNEEEALSLAEEVKHTDSKKGYVLGYRYRVSDDGKHIVFLDNTDEMVSTQELILILIFVSLFFVVMITSVFWALSKRIVTPFEENARMQKQFITDASHELKTPLAIISANAEVLAYKDGENEWINNITSQVTRVSELVNELLTLNRLEEVEEITDIEPVDLSAKANEIVDSFAEIFNSKHVSLIREIEPGVTINGNPSQLERLISVLTENASKYVSENGEIRISLSKEPRRTQLTVYNTCEINKDVDYTHLFDRFYRPDSSRTSKTGGHGVGLSIAKRIVTLHNGTIAAVPSENGLSFVVKLSNKLKPKSSKA